MTGSAFLAAEGYEAQLAGELAQAGVPVSAIHGRLMLSPAPPVAAAWAADIWLEPQEVAVASVKAAADALRAVGRNWAGFAAGLHRRSALVEARLPPVKAAPLVFPAPAPASHLGAWTLLAPDRLLFSPLKTSPVPNGAFAFAEDRVGPPSRAYLKLWEACTRMGAAPRPGERCIELGASPGGWTWAIARCGAAVRAVDRSPLDPAVAAMPGVTFTEGNAFALPPEPVDWLFSDVIAYPAPLLEMVRRWMEPGGAARIVCTIKLQGETDHAAVAEFAALPGATVAHLHHNKHELTLLWCRDGAVAWPQRLRDAPAAPM